MKGPYDDIIHLPYSGSPTRKRMSMIDRGAQFSPFAALTGYDAAILETARLTDRYIDLDVDGTAAVNGILQLLMQQQETQPEITVTYFVPDERKSGGAYVRITGNLRKIDPDKKVILMTDGTILDFNRIYDIMGDF